VGQEREASLFPDASKNREVFQSININLVPFEVMELLFYVGMSMPFRFSEEAKLPSNS